MNDNAKLLEALAASQIFREYEYAYNEAIGLPVALRPVESWRLPLHGKNKENQWCSLMAGQSRCCAACLHTQERLAQAASEQGATVSCGYGMCETAVPLKVGNETVGFIQTGQVMRHQPQASHFQAAFSKAEKLGAQLDARVAEKAFFKTPVVSPRKLESISSLLAIFADHLSILSNQIALKTAREEPQAIARARQFMEAHYTEDISLGQVAAAAGASLFYFCKLFKRTTGINFTEYLSRIRAERAKNLLLNPNLRVGEIAFAVGFQSLTHFNRVFKKIVGESPRTYRNRIPSC